MKRFAIFLLALVMLLAPAVVTAQITPASKILADTKTYANSQSDTLPAPNLNKPTGYDTGVRIASASLLSVWFKATDSVEVIRYVQYRAYADTTWNTIYTDSTTSLTGNALAPTVDEDMIRSAVLDKWTYAYGISGYLRLVCAFRATKNGTNTVAAPTTYSAGFFYRP